MKQDFQYVDGKTLRLAARAGELHGPTSGCALSFAQANLVVLPKDTAFDFLLFCQRNPKACPLLDVTDPGDPTPHRIATDADIRTDVTRFLIYRDGNPVDEVTDLLDLWRNDLVAFFLGCSFTFEHALLQGGVPVRHIELRQNVSMYQTNIECRNAGIFHGPLTVSMRPMTMPQAIKAIQICSRFPKSHGAPVHIGDPKKIGIKDLHAPDFGDPPVIKSDEVPVFWACGVTPQSVAMRCKVPFMITHKPGHMFVSDLRDFDMENLDL